MKILFLTYDLPYPLVAGGKIRAYHLIKNISRHHQITLFSYYRHEEQKKYLPELKKYCLDIQLFKRRKPWSWQNLLRTFLTPFPFPAATYFSPQVKTALTEELKKKKYDLVHFESFYPALYLPLAKQLRAKTLLGNENVESQVYQRYADSRRFFLLRWLLRLEVLRMRLFEENLWRQADVNIAPSEADAKVIERVTKKPCYVVPNGIDPSAFKKIKTKRKGPSLIFIGTLIYPANSDAVRFFLKEIYPEIKKRVKKVRFLLFSWQKPNWLKTYLRDPSVKFVQDRATPSGELFQQGDILVAPMRIASGTNIKVLEAMAAGLPVVTTSIGAEGIELEENKQAIICDQPEEFSQAVVKLLGSQIFRQRIGRAGRVLVTKKYNWENIGKKLEKVYQE